MNAVLQSIATQCFSRLENDVPLQKMNCEKHVKLPSEQLVTCKI
jgi:hypothetical protein